MRLTVKALLLPVLVVLGVRQGGNLDFDTLAQETDRGCDDGRGPRTCACPSACKDRSHVLVAIHRASRRDRQ